MLISYATSVLKVALNIATPCSVKTKGNALVLLFALPIWDHKLFISSSVNQNIDKVFLNRYQA